MKLSGTDKLFMEARNEEIETLRKEVVSLKKELEQQAQCKMPPSCEACICYKKCQFKKYEAFGCYQTLWCHFARLP
jgi:hypothetical protein